MINQGFAPIQASSAAKSEFRPAKIKHNNPFVFIILAAALLISITQVGCTGLTTANATDPASPTSSTTLAVAGATGAFGSVATGSSGTQTFTVSNTGAATLTITQLAASGSGFSVSGFALPINVAVGQSTTFSAKFTPTAAGAVTGSISMSANTNPAVTVIALAGTGAGAGQPAITVNPAAVSFGNVTVGAPNSQTVLIQNPGTVALTISSATASGTGFSIIGLGLPTTVAAGSSTTFNVAFAPAVGGTVSGSLSLASNAGSALAVPLSGTGVASTMSLSASTSNLTFGNVAVGSNSAQNVALTNNGNSTVTVATVSVTGVGFSSSGVVAGQTIGAGQTALLGVTFSPALAVAASGAITVTSSAANSPINISLSGTGTQTVAHSVTLNWTASTSSVVGYNVYRSTTSGGPYALITSSPLAGTTFTDTTVQAGVTYYYVVTAVDSSGNESAYSNEASVTVPTP
jgi:hypothetical protein